MTRKSTATVATLGATPAVVAAPAFTAADCAAMIADAFKIAIPQIVTAVSNVAAPVAPAPMSDTEYNLELGSGLAEHVETAETVAAASQTSASRLGKLLLGYSSTIANPAALPHSKAWASQQTTWIHKLLDTHGGDADAVMAVFDADRAERRAKRAAKRDAAANNVANAVRPAARPVTVASNTPAAAGKTAIRRTAAELAALGIIVTG